MEKINNYKSNNNINMKQSKENKILKINPIYFSIKLIPYNILLNNIMIYLHKKLSPKLFNDIYIYFIKEIKKYINISPYKTLNSFGSNNNNNLTLEKKNQKIKDFCLNKDEEGKKNKKLKIKQNINKKLKPIVGLSYAHKINNLKSKKNISISSFSNLNIKILDIKKFYSIYKNNNTCKNKNCLNKTENNNKTNSNEKNTSKKKKKITLNNNKFKMNEKLKLNKIILNKNHYNTISSSIHKKSNYELKKTNIIKKNEKRSNNRNFSDNIRKKISNNRTLKNIPHQTFLDIINRNSSNNKYKSNNNSNIKKTLSINKAIFNKNNKNIVLFDGKKKLKIINIKVQNSKNNGGEGLKKSLQTSEEMLKQIKNSLDDENLKGMLNFSYENFLSKESERESKEYSIED